jgi:sugar/nucleoside kinase (ribokinase family)
MLNLMRKILGVGNALVDIIIQLNNDQILDRFSLPKGSMQLVDASKALDIEKECVKMHRSMASGGSAANTIHGLSRLGISTGFIGTVGQDEAGKFFNKDMVQAGITPFLSFSKTQTGRAISLVSPDSERTFATFLGAAVELSTDNILDASFNDFSMLHLEGYLAPLHALVETAMKKAKEKGLKISIDLASYNVVESNLDFLKKMISSYADIVFANELEAQAFTGQKNPMDSLHEIARICKVAIVKIGEKGSIIQRGNEVHSIGVTPVKCLDTTGAGDLYAAGFLYGMDHNLPLEKCGHIGAILAANVIEELGAKISDSRWKKIKQELEKI